MSIFIEGVLKNTIDNLEGIEKEEPRVSPIINELAKIKEDHRPSIEEQLTLFSSEVKQVILNADSN